MNGEIQHIPAPKEEKRKVSLEEDFMEWRTNDLLYGELLYMSSLAPDKTLYVTKDNFINARERIMETCEYSSAKSLYNNLDKLKKANLIAEANVAYNKTASKPSYVFLYNENNRYQFIQREMVYYLISTRNRNCLRIYTYLLNKLIWKKQNGFPYYEFTLNELRTILHYDSKRTPDKALRHIIESFYREGLIDYECAYRTCHDKSGKTVPSPVFRLTNVIYYVEDLPPVPSHRRLIPSHKKAALPEGAQENF
ncbi:MAG: hypothetical protein MJ066_06295 [Clostridia bacterium]|nr:hypothetical protein [Clostridia bacterium]